MLSWKHIFRGWAGIPVLILVVLAVVWLFTNGLPGYKSWQLKRAYEKMNDLYLNDTYGGATPEETYDLFIDALKNGDVELASKYFVIDSQDNWLLTLDKYKQSGYLGNFIDELENTRKIWEKSEKSTETTASFKYRVLIKKGDKATIGGQEVEIPPGDYLNESVFTKYPTGVWKIEGL